MTSYQRPNWSVLLYHLAKIITSFALLFVTSSILQGATLFESASIGPTGIVIENLYNQTIKGLNIGHRLFSGVRFRLNSPVEVENVGGHFIAFEPSNSLFAAIVSLDEETDFPNSFELVSNDVLGVTLIDLPQQSAEVFGELSLQLSPGWYALVFGSDLFGATGGGGAVLNGQDFGMPSYITASENIPGIRWEEHSSNFRNMRFVVNGFQIPEPASLSILFVGIANVFLLRRHRTIRGFAFSLSGKYGGK